MSRWYVCCQLQKTPRISTPASLQAVKNCHASVFKQNLLHAMAATMASTWRLLCSSFVTNILESPISKQAMTNKELHRSLQVHVAYQKDPPDQTPKVLQPWCIFVAATMCSLISYSQGDITTLHSLNPDFETNTGSHQLGTTTKPTRQRTWEVKSRKIQQGP